MEPSTIPADSLLPAEETASPEHPVRPFYWSVRRELWENRSIYLAPFIVAIVVVFGSMFSVMTAPRRVRQFSGDATRQHLIAKPLRMAPAPIILTTFLVGLFYALDALYGERRDRSILFWKSLPVSDATSVLSKASIPLAVLPAVGLILGLGTQLFLLMMSTAVLMASGLSPGILWSEYNIFEEPLVMLYGLAVHALWFAPIYAWLLLVSAWAKRTPILWATLPFLAVMVLERMAFGTKAFAMMIGYRFTGAMKEAFSVDVMRPGGAAVDHVWQLTPARFLTAPGLWFGLVLAAAAIGGAVRLRRNREPI